MSDNGNKYPTLNIAIIGCGRITESGHLPAVLSMPSLNLTVLVDKDLDRAKTLKDSYAINCEVMDDFREIVNICDLAIIATPNSSHYAIASYLLTNKIHILIEKPLTVDSKEADQLCLMAESNDCVLSAAFVTRFFPSTILMNEMIEKNYFGKIESFEYEYGGAGGWAPVSGYNLDRKSSGGGVLLVSGTHFLDRMLYWFGEPEILECYSDSHGGVEANFQAKLLFKNNNSEFIGDFFVSKTYRLKNAFRLKGQNCDALLPEGQSEWIKIFPKHDMPSFNYHVYPEKEENNRNVNNYFIQQLNGVVDSVVLRKKPLIDGRAASKSVKLAEDLYKKAQSINEPWIYVKEIETSSLKENSDATKILITGASGLVGGALTERLYLDQRYQFRAIVHNTGKAARIARLPIEIVRADLLNKKEVDQAVQGCSMIVNLVRGGGAVDTRGLKNLLDAALKFKISKFVHLSSVAVYGHNPPEGSEDESFPPDPGENKYGRLKLRQEKIIQKYIKKGLPAVILRPPNIYGPFSIYTLNTLDRFKSGKAFLFEGGKNPCNVVHVYNLVEAIILALESEKSVGKTYFITDGDSITWKDFIEVHAALLDKDIDSPEISLHDLTIPEPLKLGPIKSAMDILKFLFSGEFRNSLSVNVPLFAAINSFLYTRFQYLDFETQNRIKKILSKPQSIPKIPNNIIRYDSFISTQNRKVRHSIEKARKELGYEPRFNFKAGMENTKLWLRSARYI